VNRKKHSIDVEIQHVRLYAEDLEAIDATLREVAPALQVETENYEYESLEELLNHDANPDEILFRSEEPDLSVTIDKFEDAEIFAYKPQDHKIHELLSDVEQILRSRRSRLRFFMGLSAALFFGAIAFINLAFYYSSDKGDGYRSWKVQTPIDGAIWAFLLFRLLSQRTPRFTLRRRSENSTFWTRNRDSLVVGLLLAVVSGVIGWLLRGQ
jgi:hypothetical protein